MRRVAAALLALFASVAHAEPGPIGQWLMSEPLTLWDWGMMKVKEEAYNAAPRAASHLGLPSAWAWYHWDNNEIEIILDVRPAIGVEQPPLTYSLCNAIRRAFIGELAHTGSVVHSTEGQDLTREWTHDKIRTWFSHDGFQRRDRDEELAEKLARIIFVKVNLWGTVDYDGITCRARIMTFDAPSQSLS